jgi:hypothetical protein
MKKIKLLGLLFTLSAFFNSNVDAMLVDGVLSQTRDDSAAALSTLQAEGIGKLAAIQDFKRQIRKSIEELNIAKAQGDLSGRIGIQIATLQDLLLLVDKMAHYDKTPSDDEAIELRNLARSNSPVREFIRDEMNKQEQAKFRFLPQK